MIGLTTQKHDLVHRSLGTNSTAATADIAQDIYLTLRQIGYGLKPILPHLAHREVVPKTTPSLDIEILCCSAGRSCLLHKLDSQADVQLVFSPGQRQQFLLLCLLTAVTSLLPNWLQHIAAVSRPTVLSELDLIANWAHIHNPNLILARGRKGAG